MRRTVSVALALLALAGAPPFPGIAPDVAAQEKDKKDKDDKEKEAERKRKEEEERQRRAKAALEKAITKIAAGFAAKDVGAVLLNVPESKDDAVQLRLDDKKLASFSKVHARGQLDAFFGEWKVIRVDTSSMSVEENVASVPLSLFKTSAEDTPNRKRLRIKVGSADDKHPLVKLVVETR